MTVYVDDSRTPDTSTGYPVRWSRLTADTADELHTFAARLPLGADRFAERCPTQCVPGGQVCPHWHYRVDDWMRRRALRFGAHPVTAAALDDLAAATEGGTDAY